MTPDSLTFHDGHTTVTCCRCGTHETHLHEDGPLPGWGYLVIEDRIVPKVTAWCPICAVIFMPREFPDLP